MAHPRRRQPSRIKTLLVLTLVATIMVNIFLFFDYEDLLEEILNIIFELVDMVSDSLERVIELFEDAPMFTLRVMGRLLYKSQVGAALINMVYYIDTVKIASIDYYLWDQYHRAFFDKLDVQGCLYEGRPLKCEYIKWNSSNTLGHVDGVMIRPDLDCKSLNHTLYSTRIVTATEPSHCLEQHNYLSTFDLEVSFRSCAQVHLHYFRRKPKLLQSFMRSPTAFESKLNSLLFVPFCGKDQKNSHDFLQAVSHVQMKDPTFRFVEHYECFSGNVVSEELISLMSRHKFCVVAEPFQAADYVSDLLWAALESGCIPVYKGAPNILEIVPDPDAIILFGRNGYRSTNLLVDEIVRLGNDELAYDQRLSWKYTRTLHDFSSGFKRYIFSSRDYTSDVKCDLCRLVARQKRNRFRYVSCLKNKTWLQLKNNSDKTIS